MINQNILIFIFLVLGASGLTFFGLYGICLLGILGISLVFFKNTHLSKLEVGWLVLVCSAFFGSYMGISGRENIFLFRIILVGFFMCSPYFFLNKEKMLPLEKVLILFLGIWLLGCVLTLFWSTYRGAALRQFYYIFEACSLFYLTFYFLKSKKTFQLTSTVIVSVYILSICVGLYEMLSGNHLKFSGSLVYETTTSQFQPTGFLFNTNDYAIYLAMFLPLVFYYFYSLVSKRWGKIFAILIWCACVYLIISTYSRLAMVSIAIVSSAILFYYFRKYIVFYPLLLSVYLMTGNNSLKQLVEKVVLSFTTKDRSSDDRMDLYRISFNLVHESNFLGIGLGAIPIKIADTRNGFESVPTTILAPHNLFLELIGELGLFSFPFFCLLFYVGYHSILYLFQGKSFNHCIGLLMLLIFLFGAIALSTVIEQRFLWIALGIAAAMPTIDWMDNDEYGYLYCTS